jgi:hypothetical protein
VTLFSRVTESTFAPAAGTAVAGAKGMAPYRTETPLAGGLVAVEEKVWHLWTANLGNVVPKVNDVLRDAAGARWTVIRVDRMSLGQRYKLTTQRER